MSLNFATMTMGFHRFVTEQQTLKNNFEVRQVHSIPREIASVHDGVVTMKMVDVGQFHNRNIVLLNVANVLSYLPICSIWIGIGRLSFIFFGYVFLSRFPKSVPEVSFCVANILRASVELTGYLPLVLLITDLAITLFRQMEYVKSWKFSFDQIADEHGVLVSVNLNP